MVIGFLRVRRFYTAPLLVLSSKDSLPPTGESPIAPGSRHSLSVVIHAPNEEGRLPGLLQSLQKQTLQPQEIIVVDDGSTDGPVELARHWGCRVLQTPKEGWSGKSAACFVGAHGLLI
ncbi:MAG TPA: glycosyltransferase [Termitinemataceae bacterium]|nr:glycosyltransferase [Termitinemataceae bacterium]